jgi:hypothetical protein
VLIGIAYTHHAVSKFPYEESSFSFKSITIHAPVFIKRYELTIECGVPVKEVVAFKTSKYLSYKNAKRIASIGAKIKKRDAPLPQQIDQRTFKWAANNLVKGTKYSVVLYFAGE